MLMLSSASPTVLEYESWMQTSGLRGERSLSRRQVHTSVTFELWNEETGAYPRRTKLQSPCSHHGITLRVPTLLPESPCPIIGAHCLCPLWYQKAFAPSWNHTAWAHAGTRKPLRTQQSLGLELRHPLALPRLHCEI